MDIRISTTVDIVPDDVMTTEQMIALMDFCIGEMNTNELHKWFVQSKYQRNIKEATQ